MKSVKYTVRLKEPIAQQVENSGQHPVDFIRGAVMEKLENNSINRHQQTAIIYDMIDELECKHPEINFSKLKEVL